MHVRVVPRQLRCTDSACVLRMHVRKKTCSTCKRRLVLSSFNKNRSKSDGHNGQCKRCFSACRGGRTPKACVGCGRQFQAQRADKVYCTFECFEQHRPDTSGSHNANWRGGITISARGYAYVRAPTHPHAVNGYVKRATLVVEKRLGRYLRRDEQAHHKNHDKLDDSDDNLSVMTVGDHAKLHGEERRKPRAPKAPRRTIAWPSQQDLERRVTASSLRRVASEIGCSHVAVFRQLRRHVLGDSVHS